MLRGRCAFWCRHPVKVARARVEPIAKGTLPLVLCSDQLLFIQCGCVVPRQVLLHPPQLDAPAVLRGTSGTRSHKGSSSPNNNSTGAQPPNRQQLKLPSAPLAVPGTDPAMRLA